MKWSSNCLRKPLSSCVKQIARISFLVFKISVCVIVGCSNRTLGDKVSFYRILCVDMQRNYKLADLIRERQKKWITRIKRDDLTDAKIKYARVCSRHFISGKFLESLFIFSFKKSYE